MTAHFPEDAVTTPSERGATAETTPEMERALLIERVRFLFSIGPNEMFRLHPGEPMIEVNTQHRSNCPALSGDAPCRCARRTAAVEPPHVV